MTELYSFIRGCSHLHLTKADVEKLQPGDRLDVVIWDRNFEEYWIWQQPVHTPYPPEIFFAANRNSLIYRGDYEWDIEFNHGETIRHPIHVSLAGLNTSWTWSPLDNDKMIHVTNYVKTKGQKGPPEGWGPIHKHISEFSPSTRMGWRGPIMLWSRLVDLGEVFYHENFDGLDTSK